MTPVKSSTGSGNFASTMTRNPYTAVFETIAERTAATSGGASRYVSGSQPCRGKSGAFTAKAIAKPRKIQVLSLVPESSRLKVPCVTPKATTEASINSEPAIV